VKQELVDHGDVVERILGFIVSELGSGISMGTQTAELLALFEACEVPADEVHSIEATEGNLLNEILRLLHCMVREKDT